MSDQPADASALMAELHALADPETAAGLQRFFKTARGQYGEQDRFLGIRVPELRKIAAKHRTIHIHDAGRLLRTPYHEARMLALLILIRQFARGSPEDRTAIYNLYRAHTEHINSWDLVDASAGQIPGAYLRDRSRGPLYELAASDLLWERRISMIATWPYIRENDFTDALAIAAILVNDNEDLIQKAVGWMLREIGKRDMAAEETFLKSHYREMPRTMLRYAIEKFPEEKRQQYLKGRV
ncbi:MAG: DNA alkylation repair protein [Desulfosalsimonas sp.]